MSDENQAALESAEREISISIETARAMVEKKDQMDALIKDKNFESLFTTGYFQDEPTRLVSLLADAEWQTEEKQQSLLDDMRAISALRQYIMNIRATGRQMERQIAASEAQLDEMRAEEGE